MCLDDVKSILAGWEVELKRLEDTLQIGRCGKDDGSFSHGRMDMLIDCIDDIKGVLK